MLSNHLREAISRKVGAHWRGWAVHCLLGYSVQADLVALSREQGTLELPWPLLSSPLLLSHPTSQVYTRYGKCYTFNADPRSLLPSRAGGMGSGLEIMLDIQQEEYLPIWRETSTQAGKGQGPPWGLGPGPSAWDGFPKVPISAVQMRRRLRQVFGCRSTARRSRPTSTSWGLGCPQASRPLCPARNSG